MIAGSQCDEMVKIKVQFTDAFNIMVTDTVLFLKQGANGIKLLLVAVCGRKSGSFNFKKQAHIQQTDQKPRFKVTLMVIYQ